MIYYVYLILFYFSIKISGKFYERKNNAYRNIESKIINQRKSKYKENKKEKIKRKNTTSLNNTQNMKLKRKLLFTKVTKL